MYVSMCRQHFENERKEGISSYGTSKFNYFFSLSFKHFLFLRSGELLAGKNNTNLHYEKVKREREKQTTRSWDARGWGGIESLKRSLTPTDLFLK